MHLPDEILSPAVCTTTLLVSGATVAFAIKKASTQITSRQPIVLAAATAGILLIQAFNFPVSSIVSGHLLGSALMAWLFGPWVAISLMALVLGLQGAILGDGGIWSFGANLLTLAIIPIMVSGFACSASAKYRTSRLNTLILVGLSTSIGYLCSALCITGLLTAGARGATGWTASFLTLNSLLPAVIEGMVTVAIISISQQKISAFFWHYFESLFLCRKAVQQFLVLAILLGAYVLIEQHGAHLPDPLQVILAESVIEEKINTTRLLCTVATGFVMILAGNSLCKLVKQSNPLKIFNQ